MIHFYYHTTTPLLIAFYRDSDNLGNACSINSITNRFIDGGIPWDQYFKSLSKYTYLCSKPENYPISQLPIDYPELFI